MDQKKCEICQKTFNSDREFQEHQRTAHSQQQQSNPSSTTRHEQQKKSA